MTDDGDDDGLDEGALAEARSLTNQELLERTESYVRRVEPPKAGLPLGPDGEPRQWRIGEAVYGFESDKVEYVVAIYGVQGELPKHMQISLADTPDGPVTDRYGFASQLRKVPPAQLDRHVAMQVIEERVRAIDSAAIDEDPQRLRERLNARCMKLLNWRPPPGY